jgi:hypothetical protein
MAKKEERRSRRRETVSQAYNWQKIKDRVRYCKPGNSRQIKPLKLGLTLKSPQ